MQLLGQTKILTEPTAEPVDIFDLKEHARITTDAENDTILAKIQAAREWCETFTNRTMMTTTFQWNLDCFPCWELIVPNPPLQSVTWIKYYDTSNTQQTLSSSAYSVDTTSEPGRITPAYGYVWPATLDIPNAVEIKFVAGYASANAVPESIKEAIRQLTTEMLENRQQSVTGTTQTRTEFAAQSLLSSHRLPEFA